MSGQCMGNLTGFHHQGGTIKGHHKTFFCCQIIYRDKFTYFGICKIHPQHSGLQEENFTSLYQLFSCVPFIWVFEYDYEH